MEQAKNIIDLTMVLCPHTKIYPGMPAPVLHHPKTHRGDGVQVTKLETSVHAGTHMDAPRHFLPEGTTIDMLDLNKLMGAAVLLNLGRPEPGSAIGVSALEPFIAKIKPGDIVLLYTGYEYVDDNRLYCYLAPEAAGWLLQRRIKALGLDVPSVDPVNNTGIPNSAKTHPCHHALLGAEVPIIEGLCNLTSLPEGRFYFCCLPLKIADGDGSPVRAIAYEP